MITQQYIEDLSFKIIGCSIEVHKNLGPGLLESIYEQCLAYELKAAGLQVKYQQSIPVKYKNVELDCQLRYDLLVEDLIVVELKAVDIMLPIFKAQLITYLKLLHKPKGLLINFNTLNISKSIESVVTPDFALLPKN